MTVTHRTKLFAGVLTLVGVIFFGLLHITAQDSTTLTYGSSVTGKIIADSPSVIYTFQGSSGDLVHVEVKRTSDSLRPIVGIVDSTQPKGKEVIAAGVASADGANSTIDAFSLPKTQPYGLIVIGDAGTTGNFSLTLDNAVKAPEATNTPLPTHPAPPTPKPPKPTAAAIIPPTLTTSTDGVATFEVGRAPRGLLWLNDKLYVANSGDNYISVLDADGQPFGKIPMRGHPRALASDGEQIWATVPKDNESSILVLYPDQLDDRHHFDGGANPYSLSYDPDNGYMWVAAYNDSQVIALDSDGNHRFEISVSGQPNTVLYTGNSRLWVTLVGTGYHSENYLIEINTHSGEIIKTLTVGKSPADLAWDSNDNLLFIANSGDNTISKLNMQTKNIETFKTFSEPVALAWDGAYLWVAMGGDSQVVAYDKNGTVHTTIPLDKAPYVMIYDGSANIWVAEPGTDHDPGNQVTRITIDAALPK
jgi:DNA-binding beta-propeller fold protein YncE